MNRENVNYTLWTRDKTSPGPPSPRPSIRSSCTFHVKYFGQMYLTVASQQSFWLVFNNFVTPFLKQLSAGGFILNWLIKMQELGRWSCQAPWKCQLSYNWQLRSSQSLRFDWPDVTRSHQKCVETMSNLSKTNKELCRVAMQELCQVAGYRWLTRLTVTLILTAISNLGKHSVKSETFRLCKLKLIDCACSKWLNS